MLALAPVAAQLAPEADGGEAEARVRLGIRGLVAADGDDLVLRQVLVDHRCQVGHGERVAVDEQEGVVVGLGVEGDHVGEQVELGRVLADVLVGGVVEAGGVVALQVVEEGVDLVRLREVALELAQLNVDPPVVAPVDRRDVGRHLVRLRSRARRAARPTRPRTSRCPPPRATRFHLPTIEGSGGFIEDFLRSSRVPGPALLVVLGRQVVRHLLKAVLRGLPVVEHHRVVVEAHEVADPAQRRLGVDDEVLEAGLHVVVKVGADPPRALDPAAPAARGVLDRRRLVHAVQARQAHVAAVADQVDEVRLGEQSLDPAHRLHVDGGLVAPARLVVAVGVAAVEGAQRRRCR